MDTSAEKHGEGNDHGNDMVEIIVNSVTYRIHRGRRTVAEIKDAGHVAAADELSQIVDGKIVPLSNDGSVVIKGGEMFVSNVPSGGSAR